MLRSIQTPAVTAACPLRGRQIVTLATLVLACGGQDSVVVTGVAEGGGGSPLDVPAAPESPAAPEAPANPETPGAPETPEATLARYFGTVGLSLPGDLQSSYTAVLPALDGTANAALQAGYESEGFVMPSSHDGFVFIPGGPSPTITKYAVDAQGAFSEVGQVSFGAYGVTNVNRGPFVGSDMVAPDKAYYFDLATQQVILWNPEAMELTGEVIDLGGVLAGVEPVWQPRVFLNYGEGFAKQRGNRLFVPVRWQNPDDLVGFVRPMGGLLVIDTDTDSVVHLLEEPRIADSIYTVLLDSGDLYLFTGGIGVSQHRIHGNAAPGGAVRVLAGQDGIDPDFYLDLNQAVGGRPATTPVYAGGSSVYVRVYDDVQQPITPELESDIFSLLAQQAWRYWKVDLSGSTPAQLISELPWTSTDGYFYSLPEENRIFLGVMEADFSKTTLYEPKPNGFEPVFEVTGTLNVLSMLGRQF